MSAIELMGEFRTLSPSQQLSANYSSLDWERLTEMWKITMHTIMPWSGEAIEQASVSLDASARLQIPRKETWDKVTEEVFTEYAEAWERLSVL